MNQAPDYLSLQHISKNFGNFSALRDINLTILKGELICFLGPSGCGKTTLLRIIAGLETQDTGEIWQKENNISRSPAAKRDYGIVFQSYALFPNLTIEENIAYGLVNRRQGKVAIAARVRELLVLVGLPGCEKKYPSQLSGGQQQRIALARALAMSPGLLLLDEPLSALDALERVRLRGEIRQLQQRLGVTTVMVTHDQEEALAMADRIVIMNQGVVEQIGTPRDIYLRPRSEFVASFIGKINDMRGHYLGAGKVKVANREFFCNNVPEATAIDSELTLYVRPEEFILHEDGACVPNQVVAVVRKIEFLGPSSMLTVTLDGLGGQHLFVSLPMTALDQFAIGVGSQVPLSIRPERIRVFFEEMLGAAA